MLAIEDVLCELQRDDVNELGLPPGFRFHPTDEELITFYLASKVFNGSFCNLGIPEVDLNRCEPWELPEFAKMGEREWYFFNLRDRKYPTGLRTNRATGAGYWKATGKDRAIHSSTSSTGALLGMKKTLVFYRGRAPRGQKTKWIMHEYRLLTDFSSSHTCKEEWVICRIYHKVGEKKNNQLNETPRTQGPMHALQNQNLFLTQNQESNLKSMINPAVSHCSDLFSSANINYRPISLVPPTENAITATDRGGEFKELMSNSVTKQFTTEARFDPHSLSWAEKIHESTAVAVYQNPLLFGMDGGGIGFTSAPAASDYCHSVAFNRAGFEIVVDHPIEETADSWPLDL
ncbi:unnamed protein product [Fraxinus pennsylvanica]|uniref:NAC domain-containing protein n=1 Tax=Fraxinus pennsylvanica TaxID=56036 RepID=A0AAD2DKK2_9LAMI|nr:unnamed protein product [Fraxinus pennsylvanica]